MKKKVTIKLVSDWQLYDILNKTYLTGEARKSVEGYTPELIASIKASNDDEQLDQIKFSIKEAIASLKSLMSEYVSDDAKESSNGGLDYSDVTLTLIMPSNFNTASLESISRLCHRYITCKAVGDWFSITSPREAESYRASIPEVLAELRNSISKRKRPERPNGATDIPV